MNIFTDENPRTHFTLEDAKRSLDGKQLMKDIVGTRKTVGIGKFRQRNIKIGCLLGTDAKKLQLNLNVLSMFDEFSYSID